MYLIRFIVKTLLQWLRYQAMRLETYRIHKILLPFGAVIKDPKNIQIGKNFGLSPFCQIYCQDSQNRSKLVIGERVNLNSGVMINADCDGEIIIGNNVLIGPNVVIRSSNHRTDDTNRPIREQGHKGGKIYIQEDVWLGADVVVLPNTTIGKGAIVGAGSVVSKDVPSYSIAVGIPAQAIRFRTQESETSK